MSLAAGIVPRVEGHRDNGPAAGEAACTQTVHGGHGHARVQRRTVAIELCSPTLSAFLEVVLGPNRPVSCTGAVIFSYLACRTESE